MCVFSILLNLGLVYRDFAAVNITVAALETI